MRHDRYRAIFYVLIMIFYYIWPLITQIELELLYIFYCDLRYVSCFIILVFFFFCYLIFQLFFYNCLSVSD